MLLWMLGWSKSLSKRGNLPIGVIEAAHSASFRIWSKTTASVYPPLPQRTLLLMMRCPLENFFLWLFLSLPLSVLFVSTPLPNLSVPINILKFPFSDVVLLNLVDNLTVHTSIKFCSLASCIFGGLALL